MIDKSVRDGPWPTKIETVQFSHRAKVNRNKPVGRDRQDSRRRELEDPAVDHTGARAQVGMDARTERRRVWSGVGGLHTDRQTLFRQRVRDQQPEPVRIADLSMHCQPSATVWGFPADHLKVLPTARTRPPPPAPRPSSATSLDSGPTSLRRAAASLGLTAPRAAPYTSGPPAHGTPGRTSSVLTWLNPPVLDQHPPAFPGRFRPTRASLPSPP